MPVPWVGDAGEATRAGESVTSDSRPPDGGVWVDALAGAAPSKSMSSRFSMFCPLAAAEACIGFSRAFCSCSLQRQSAPI